MLFLRKPVKISSSDACNSLILFSILYFDDLLWTRARGWEGAGPGAKGRAKVVVRPGRRVATSPGRRSCGPRRRKRRAGLVATHSPRGRCVVAPAGVDGPSGHRKGAGFRGADPLHGRPSVDAASLAGRIPPGTGSVSLFLVNERIPSTDRDESFAFLAEIEVRSVAPDECGRMPGTRGRDREGQTVCRVARRLGLAPP